MSAPHGTGVESGNLCRVVGHCFCMIGKCCWCAEPWREPVTLTHTAFDPDPEVVAKVLRVVEEVTKNAGPIEPLGDYVEPPTPLTNAQLATARFGMRNLLWLETPEDRTLLCEQLEPEWERDWAAAFNRAARKALLR